MSRRRQIYEGKAKILYEGPEPGTLIQYFKDDATAFNAQKKGTIQGKGVINNRISEYVFTRLNHIGVPNHFIRRLNMREQLVRQVEIIPIEVVVRNVAAGSISKRLGIPEGEMLPHTLIEYYYKDDALGDPLIAEEHIACFGWANHDEMQDIAAMAIRVNDFMAGMFAAINIRLVDFKLEFGRIWDGDFSRVILADEISPDGCRLWDMTTGEKLDKDRFRRDLGGEEEAYQEVARRLGLLQDDNGPSEVLDLTKHRKLRDREERTCLRLPALALLKAMRVSLIALLVALAPMPLAAKDKPAQEAVWAFDRSDIPVDPDFRFGRLANGMRYIVRHNATPAGTAIVRMDVEAGSLDESPAEQGFAHFLEHMAFNGSQRVPEGQMVPLLEREGLAFGADTNASTSFDRTLYKLDLPRNDPALIDTALMLMRETASNLTISQEAVNRERGVVLAEMRDRNSWALRNAIDTTRFFYPKSLYAQRFPIGTVETLNAADAASLRAFYEREYVPAHVTLVVVGDFDVATVEAGIVRHFNDWTARPAEPQPFPGPVKAKDKARTGVYLDPALSERVTVQRNGTYQDEPDSIAERRETLLRSIGYDIVNRRLQRLARSAEPPFRGAGFGTGDVFKAARSTRIIIDTVDGKWRAGLEAAGIEYRRALAYGFSAAEVAEQVAQVRTGIVNAAASASTRSNAMLTALALSLVDDEMVPSTPQSGLERFERFAPQITPDAVLAALKREALTLNAPLIRFQGRKAPEGGETALRDAWREVMRAKIDKETGADTAQFAYTDFGPAGQVVSDTRREDLGIREVRFANGVMLNLRKTDLEKDRVRVSLAIDGGDRLNTRENPHATQLVPNLDDGGLGKHSRDSLDTILAGRSVGLGLSSAAASFDSRVTTTPRDLEIQLQLLAALVTDPGYRPEGEVRYRQAINNYFAQLDATPASALAARIGGILSDDDPRFSLGNVEDYRHLSYAKLKTDVSDRLARGAIEIGLVGDIDEDAAIALVARTFGALPARETVFHGETGQPPRLFAKDRSARIVRHTGPADQALLRITWPTRDDADPVEALELELLERVMRVELTDQLREALGKAYSPSASSQLSHEWKGYGTFSVNASVDVAEVPATRAAIRQVLDDLRKAPVSTDILLRARQPMIEGLANALKSNAGWMALVDHAQSEPDRIERFQNARERLLALTPADVQAMAQRYLAPEAGLEVLALPKDVTEPK